MKTQNDTPTIYDQGSSSGRREEFSLIALLTLFWKHRRTMLGALLIGLIVSVIYGFVATKTYQSTVSLMPPDPSLFSGNDLFAMAAGLGEGNLDSASALAGGLLGENSTGDLFLAILQSQTVEDDIINRLNLMPVYRAKTHEEARRALLKSTDAKVEPKSQVIYITVTDEDRYRAQAIASAYIVELDNLVSRLNTSGAHRERVFLENRLKVLSDQLDTASQNLSQFSSRSATLDMDVQGKAIMDAAAKLQGELIAAKSDLSGLQSVYAPDNSRVRAEDARVAELTAELRKMGGAGQGAADSETLANQLYPSLRELPLVGSKYMGLERRVKILETVYEILTKQYELAKVEEAKEIPSVKVLDQASLAEKRYSPKRKMVVIFGLIIAFLISSAWIYFREAWRGLNRDDPRRVLAGEVATALRRIIPKRKEKMPAKAVQ